jgi:hypothetical protein
MAFLKAHPYTAARQSEPRVGLASDGAFNTRVANWTARFWEIGKPHMMLDLLLSLGTALVLRMMWAAVQFEGTPAD